jgi:hypothetical protein
MMGLARPAFDKDVLRALIDNIGLYPPQSVVRLSDSRQAVVIGINRGYPLRPKVKVVKDARGDDIGLPRQEIIDLLKETALSIEEISG